MNWQANTWQISPCGEDQFKIILKGNENTQDGSSQSGWILSSQRKTDIDKRNENST